MFPLLRRKASKSAPLIERARELGIRLPDYVVPSAQAAVEMTPEVERAAAKIAQSVVDNDVRVVTKAQLAHDRTSGTGRSASDPMLIVLDI